MEGDREDVSLRTTSSGETWIPVRNRSKNSGGTVALVHIAVESHRGTNLLVTLHAANRDGDIIDHAKAFAVIGKGVVKSATNRNGNAIVERGLGSEYRTACCQPESVHQLRGEGNFQL